MSGGQTFLKYQQDIGVRGSKQLSRQTFLDQLALGGSTAAEGVRPADQALVNTAMCQLFSEHTRRLLADPAWCAAFADAVSAETPSPNSSSSAATRTAPAATTSRRRVLVLGLGSGVPALTAARAGCEVVWAERVGRFAELCAALARANDLSGTISVCRVQQYSDVVRLVKENGGRKFDLVVTEDGIGDDPLADGLLHFARLARRSLLVPSGHFVPSKLRLFATLHSVRTTCVAGFDLRGFNAFRNHDAIWYDAEHAASQEGVLNSRTLSKPLLLLEINLNSTADMAQYFTVPASSPSATTSPVSSATARAPAELCAEVTAPGVLNSASYWFELGFPNGGTLHLGPPEVECISLLDGSPRTAPKERGSSALRAAAPRPATTRAKRQQLRFLGYERSVEVGEKVRLTLEVNEHSVVIDCPASKSAETFGDLTRWPRANLLGYHFHMIADEGRNGAFDRALVSAVRAFREHNGGRAPRCLDIGSGSGLLAMMAARAGAEVVHSLEMVPALARCATHIVNANGYSKSVTIHSIMSTDLDPATVGGKFDILVCEIVDDLLLGESVLTTVADARRRLLTPRATILPRGGSLWAVAVEMLPPSHAGLNLTPLHELSCATVVSCNPNDSVKLQHHKEGWYYRRLAAPMKLLSFSWSDCELDELGEPKGESARLPLTLTQSGILTALVVFLKLDLNGEPENEICTGPDSPNTAWDQCARHLPVPLRVRKGEVLTVVAKHTDCYLQTLEVSGFATESLVCAENGPTHVVGLPHLVRNPQARGLSVTLQ